MIEQYLERLGLAEVPASNIDGVDDLLRAHTSTIAFENLDILLGRGIRIDSASVFDKIVRQGRGGYCFEQNRLFSDILTELGLPNRTLLCRGRFMQPLAPIPPYTHVCLLVDCAGEEWLVDAGFGATYIAPMKIEEGVVTRSGHRLRRFGEPGCPEGQWWLERSAQPAAGEPIEWQPVYSFDLFPVPFCDLEQASHWTSTLPDSRFTTNHIVSIGLENGFAAMTDRTLTFHGPEGKEVREIETVADYAAELRDTFRLAVTDDEVAALPLFALG